MLLPACFAEKVLTGVYPHWHFVLPLKTGGYTTSDTLLHRLAEKVLFLAVQCGSTLVVALIGIYKHPAACAVLHLQCSYLAF